MSFSYRLNPTSTSPWRKPGRIERRIGKTSLACAAGWWVALAGCIGSFARADDTAPADAAKPEPSAQIQQTLDKMSDLRERWSAKKTELLREQALAKSQQADEIIAADQPSRLQRLSSEEQRLRAEYFALREELKQQGAAVPIADEADPPKPTVEMPDIAGFWMIAVPKEALSRKAKITPAQPEDNFNYLLSITDVPPLKVVWLPDGKIFKTKTELESDPQGSSYALWVTPDGQVLYLFRIPSEDDLTSLIKYFGERKTPPDEKEIRQVSGHVLRGVRIPNRAQGGDFFVIETKDGLDAYSETTGTWDRVAIGLPDGGFPRLTAMTVGQHLGILRIRDQVLVYNSLSGRWKSFSVSPTEEAVIRVGKEFVAAQVGDQLLGFSAKADQGSLLTIPPEFRSKAVHVLGLNSLTIQLGDKAYALSPRTGQWTSPEGKPNEDDAAHIKVFPLKHGAASLFRRMLLAFFPEARIQVDHHTNSLIVVTADDNQLGEIQAVLMRLDVPAESESADAFPTSKTDASDDASVTKNFKVIHLQHVDAVETSKKLNSYYRRNYSTADPRTNSVILQASDNTELLDLVKKVEEYDASQAKRSKDGFRVGPKVATPVSPAAQRLADEIARHEAEAVELAKQIRNRSNQFGKNHPEQTEARQKMQNALAAALELKFQLEALQLESLRDRLSRLEQQIGQRKALRQKIVDRRVEELIEGEATLWDNSADEAPATSQAKTDNEAEEVATATLAKQEPKPPQEERGDSETGEILNKIPPDQFTGLVDAQAAVAETKSELVRQEQLFKAKVTPREELNQARRAHETAVRWQQILRDAYASVLQDLELQIQAAKLDLEAAAVVVEALQAQYQAGVPDTTFAMLEAAKRRHRQSKLALERLQNRLELYRKAGEIDGSFAPKLSSAPVTDDRESNDLADAQTLSWERLGLKLRPLNSSEKQLTGSRYRGGLVVTQVKAESPAAAAGFRENDILVGLGKWETVMPQNVTWVLAQTKGDRSLKFVLLRGQEIMFGNLAMDDAE